MALLRSLLILTMTCILFRFAVSCSIGFCDKGEPYGLLDGWYCCSGDSVLCERGKMIYTDICPDGCDRGLCVRMSWCRLTTTSRSNYCNITYLVDRDVDFIEGDLEAQRLYESFINGSFSQKALTTNGSFYNSTFESCLQEDYFYHLAACYQVYKPCNDPDMNLCREYTHEANKCSSSLISEKDCVWNDCRILYPDLYIWLFVIFGIYNPST